MESTKNIAVTALVLITTVLFFGLSGTDIWVQSHFYNPQTHQWIVDTNNEVLKFIFYDGIKRLLIIIAVIFLLVLIVGWNKEWMRGYRRGFFIVILSSIIVPVAVGSLKAVTNMPCPKNVETFGGVYPHTCVWEKYTAKECHLEKQKCWPAGHASGGFALLSLIFLFHSRRNKILSAVVAMVIGWSMGSYKMLIGDHFLSHTVITMILAWLLILLIVRGVDWVIKKNLKVIDVQ
ncbi:MAG: phosphatase PAP2 family protein [Sulfuricurvum sp.]|uniref:phosphatase PAP2 family protein n=1 Tax=Sulfuricurvum sp. TaxID=2025608 RepID=UPI00260AA478|nr:phosphatase PAP2 family protein [Sulfuricurvum sp.]MDD2828016.1 phosphatase PAP2 family protein [Sulfuricurvum sp.]MDD4948107.1 phosphatase PAP2 family protein [Sulfuricurvum sp.]